eukprot:1773149-Heterocapsa_arctica.AAC.1
MGTKHWQFHHHSFMVKTWTEKGVNRVTLIKATPKGGCFKRKAANDERKESTEGDSQGDQNDRRQAPEASEGDMGNQHPGGMMGNGAYQQQEYGVPPPQGKGPTFTPPGWNQHGYHQPLNTGNSHWVADSAVKGGGHWE